MTSTEAAPYGYVVPKDETEFAQAIVEALKEIDKDGAYKAALEKWGVQQGAISDFAVNPRSRARARRHDHHNGGPAGGQR